MTAVLVGALLAVTVVVLAAVLFGVLRSAHVALLLAACLPFPVVLLVAEVLSAVGALRPAPLVVASCVVLGGIAVTAALAAPGRSPVDAARGLVRVVLASVREGGPPRLLLVAAVAGVLAVTFLVGVATAPNNPDSLNYHLPRVMQWFQLSRMGAFATPYPAQVYMPPGAETTVALLLAGIGEHAMFLAQWVAQGVLGLAVYSTARHLGVSRTPATGGTLLAVSAPLVVGEAATTQNDLVATAFVLLAVALVSAPERSPHRWWLVLGSLGSVAFAVAVKPSVALFAVPVALWALWVVVRGPRRTAVLVLVAAAVLGASLNLGWLLRNQMEFGRPTGPDVGLTVQGDHLRAVASNAVKNIGHNLAVPAPRQVDEGVERALTVASEGVSGVAVDDPRFSFTPLTVDSQRNEDRAANLLQLLLGSVAVVVVLVHRSTRRRLAPVLLVAGTGYLGFSGLVQYQAWGGRFLLPLVGLGAVVVAAAVDLSRRRVALTVLVGVLALVQSVPWLVAQKWRPLVGSGSVLVTDDDTEVLATLPPEVRGDWRRALALLREDDPDVLALAGPRSYRSEYVWWRAVALTSDTDVFHVDIGPSGVGAGQVVPDADVVIRPWRTPADGEDDGAVTDLGSVTVVVPR
jgi:4-amino-4-deoxy-L-arabinose transferase-like glycosyltransferase